MEISFVRTTRLIAMLVIAFCALAPLAAQPEAPAPALEDSPADGERAGDADAGEALVRGPVNEAFAEPVVFDAAPAASKRCPPSTNPKG